MFVIYYYKMVGAKQGAPISARAGVARSGQVRRTNLGALLQHLRERGPSSRSELVSATGLTRNAIGELVGALADRGLVVESAAAPDGRPGRPSPMVRVDDTTVAVIAVEIGYDEMVVAAVGLDGKVIASASDRRGDPPFLVGRVIDAIVRRVDDLTSADGRVEGRKVIGVGLAIPALIGRDGRRVAIAPNLRWSDVDVARDLEVALRSGVGLDVDVHVGNDADVGALAEARFGAGRSAGLMVYVSGEVGVGGGLVLDGRRIEGRLGLSGEVGHLPVNPDGAQCRCGAVGCWETEIGERALLHRAGIDPDGGAESVRRLLAVAAAPTPQVEAAFAEQGRWMGLGIAGLVNVFDPDTIVLGGLLRTILPYVRVPLDAEVARRRIQGTDRDVPVVAATVEPSSALVGAAELAFAPLLADPAMARNR